MKEGEVRVLYIHPDLAYGTAGQLPPNSLLIFEVKLIEANDDNVSVTE
ncbi:peptidyl-prolyl cis-trans isomerase [Chlamydia trachomatis]|nr:peptidyl-prolyl cis-trans isomerase [Chlamydia trachomatis]